jgi:pimeloyl-ACP methyl ester carboxylesterase/DNA-binding winged helix-turn-helix (wHTH) protein
MTGRDRGQAVHRIGNVEIDVARREVRRHGSPTVLQPRAFDVLAYLVDRRDRVVSKQELLRALWPDVHVTDGSLQRAISLARSALGEAARCLRTVPTVGYRFSTDDSGNLQGPDPSTLRPSFAQSGDVYIAYQTLGETRDVDIVVVPGWVFPMRAFFTLPAALDWITTLSRYGRVVLFDKRGTGLSDRVKALPSLEQRMDDLRAVLDDVGSQRAVIIGCSEGGPLSVLFATTYPDRTQGLLLAGSFARWSAAADYPAGWTPDRFDFLRRYISREWGAGETIRAVVQSHADDADVMAWASRAEQEGASPGAALELLEMNRLIDVRPLLPVVAVPTAIVHHRGDAVISIDNARYLAEHIAGAQLVEIDGTDHLCAFEGVDAFEHTVRSLLGSPKDLDARCLTTVVVLRTRQSLTPSGTEAIVLAHRGVAVGGPEPMWAFDGPERALQCGHALAAHLSSHGVVATLAIHTGEAHRRGGAMAGEAVDAANAIAEVAQAGEIRVSQVVRDLVHGFPAVFDSPRTVQRPGRQPLDTLASRLPDRQETVRTREERTG